MKIVINRRYGGFCLSVVAELRILELEGIQVYPFVRQLSSENNCYLFKKYDGEDLNGSIFEGVSFFKAKPESDIFSMSADEYYKDEGPEEIFVDYYDSSKRNDKSLVKVVEELGQAANSRYSELKIVEIPDHHEFLIHEYDGAETVYHGIELGKI